MPSSLTVILWRSAHGAPEMRLLGRPVWHWTLDTVRALRPRHTLLTGSQPALSGSPDIRYVSPSELSRALEGRDHPVLLLPAELACLRTHTLKRVVAASKSSRRAPKASGTAKGACPSVICTSTGAVRAALGRVGVRGGYRALSRRLAAFSTLVSDPEDFLEVARVADLAEAARILRRRQCGELMAHGVLLDDPSTVQIEPGVVIGRGTRIRGWVVIEGSTRIGPRCDIGSFCRIVDTVIGADSVVLDHCFVRSSRIGSRAQLGPFAHLRPESVMASGSKVGNFVELKKTVLGPGSKAPHLSYLGDARIGRRVNVGAGTITCNYDGERKHTTIIEDGVFIGSDVQLIAPVRVGRGAYVAAGSCIVEDVPARSLALARSRQVVKPDWVRRRRNQRQDRNSPSKGGRKG